MTRIIFHSYGGLCNGFRADGHAGYDIRGHDIVCAAVSALIQGTLLALQELTTGAVEREQEDGCLKCQIRAPDEHTQLLVASLELALVQLETEYAGFIEVCHE